MNPNTPQSRLLPIPASLLLLLITLFTLPACSSSGPASLLPATIGPATQAPSTLEVTADWADVPAATDIAISRCETSITHTNDPAQHFRLYQHSLLNIRSQRGTLTIERVNPPAATSPRSVDRLAVLGAPSELIRITVHIDPSGDATLESALLSALTQRLAQLKGKGAVRLNDEAQSIKD